MEIVLWLINVDLESHQRDDLGWNPLVARVIDDESLVPKNVPSLLHQVCELAHFEQVALFNDSRIGLTLRLLGEQAAPRLDHCHAAGCTLLLLLILNLILPSKWALSTLDNCPCTLVL